MNVEQIDTLIKDWKRWPPICSNTPLHEQFTPLVNGLTNSNVLFTPSDNPQDTQYVIRFNAPNAQSLGLNRHAEWHIHQRVAQNNICTPFVYRAPKDIYWIRPYINRDTLQEHLLQEPNDLADTIKRCINKLKMVHNTPTSSAWPKINFKNRTDHYWKQIFNRLAESDKYLKNRLEKLKISADHQLKSHDHPMRLCHMDPNPNNWIIDKQDTFLIDWEYSAIGDPSWDLAVFCDTCGFSENQKKAVLKQYGSGRIKLEYLNTAQKQMQYLSALWYCVQNIITPKNLSEVISEIVTESHSTTET